MAADLHNKLVITIDGPAGAGKSTAAGNLARKLGLIHLNSGRLYRAVGIDAHRAGVPLESEEAVLKIAEALRFEWKVNDAGDSELLVNGKNEDEALQSSLASDLSSKVAVYPRVREMLNRIQRELAARASIVVEGRDTGSVVFRDAPAKFFLDASPVVRAERRAKETGENPGDVLHQSGERDTRDRNRAVAPLAPSDDAIRIDTSKLDADEVVEKMISELKLRGLLPGS